MVVFLTPFSKTASSGVWCRIHSMRTAGYWSTPPASFRKRFTCGKLLSFHAGHDVTTPVFSAAAAVTKTSDSKASVSAALLTQLKKTGSFKGQSSLAATVTTAAKARYVRRTSGRCAVPIRTTQDCDAAAAALGFGSGAKADTYGPSPFSRCGGLDVPSGCIWEVRADVEDAPSFKAVWRTQYLNFEAQAFGAVTQPCLWRITLKGQRQTKTPPKQRQPTAHFG